MNTHDKIELADEVLEQIIRESRNSDGTLEFARRIARAAIEADRKNTAELLKNPVHVHTNMCRGIIAPITFDQLAHVLGDEATKAWIADRKRRDISNATKAYNMQSTEPVKRKRPYAQGTALGEFGVIPMCDQVDDETVKSVNKTDWNAELASWSDEDFVQVFHECPDLANRLRKILAEPVKVPNMTTKSDTERERAEFEAWAQNSFEMYRHSAGEYSSNFTQTAWAAWQARAALQSQHLEDAERLEWLVENMYRVDIDEGTVVGSYLSETLPTTWLRIARRSEKLSTTPAALREIIMSNPTVNNPFQQGQSAARHPCGTWFDCPYSSFKGPVDAYKQRQWFRGWDQEKRRDSLPVIGPYGNIMIDRIRNVDRAVIGAYGQVMIARRDSGDNICENLLDFHKCSPIR